MKILVITTFYPPPERKDLLRDTSAVHYIAREWVKQGHQVTVLHCYGHYFRELVKELGKHDFRRYGKIQECPNNEGQVVSAGAAEEDGCGHQPVFPREGI